jgi:hypothetical protein
MFQGLIKKLRGARDEDGVRAGVAAFGKHPAWDDHVPDMGLQSERLVRVKQQLYLQGIGGNVDAGAWDEQAGQPPRPEFGHVFLWSGGTAGVLGRLWSSRDRKNRTRYPMIVCAEWSGCPVGVAAPVLARLLERLEARCRATDSADVVAATIEAAGAEAQDAVTRAADGGALVEPGDVAGASELGPDRVGLLRLLYQFERDVPDGLLPASASGSPSRIARLASARTHARVPRAAPDAQGAVLAWDALLSRLFLRGMERWVICPLREPWVDLLLGPADDPRGFACLRAGLGSVPLATDVPYQLDADFQVRARDLLARVSADPRADTAASQA